MDLSPEMLRASGSTYKETFAHDLKVKWPIEDNFADIITCNGVFVYVDDCNVLDEFARVTKTGGMILLMIRKD